MLRHIEAFADDHAEYKRKQEIDLLPTEQRTYAKQINLGKTHEEALVEVGRLKALSGERGEMSKERKALKQEAEALKLERAALEKQRRVASVPRVPKPREEKPTINHGDNPWETGLSLIHI